MIQRTRVHRLVVATLQVSNGPQSARELFSKLAQSDPRVMREEKVRGFKSFVKILNTFRDVRPVEKQVREYAVAKANA